MSFAVTVSLAMSMSCDGCPLLSLVVSIHEGLITAQIDTSEGRLLTDRFQYHLTRENIFTGQDCVTHVNRAQKRHGPLADRGFALTSFITASFVFHLGVRPPRKCGRGQFAQPWALFAICDGGAPWFCQVRTTEGMAGPVSDALIVIVGLF